MSLDNVLRKLLYGTMFVVSAYSAKAQIPVLPDFDRKATDSTMTIGHIEGPITWKSYSTVEHNSPAVEKRVMEGVVKVTYHVWPFSTAISIGVLTKVDTLHNLVESIVYSQGEEDVKVTPYQKKLAAKQGIDTTDLSSFTYEALDYDSMKITDQETGKDILLEPGVMDLQTTFASLIKYPKDNDTTRAVWYRGEKYDLQLSVKCYPDSIEIHADLYTRSSKDPDEKQWMFPVIKSIDIRTDRQGRPYFVRADGKFILPIYGSVKFIDR